MASQLESDIDNQTAEPSRTANRLWRGWLCCATFLIAPLGWFVRGRFIRRLEPERLNQGLILILPGIEGRSFLNIAMLQGMLDAQVPYALEIVDWTTGNKLLALYHLRASRRNRNVAKQIALRIVQYQQDYPGRPVWIVGHSGGGGMALLTASLLPRGHKLTGLILLAAAVSRRYPLSASRDNVERGIWNFHSVRDFLFVGLGTTLFGTMDGCHGPAAGMLGFHSDDDDEATLPPMIQVKYQASFWRKFNLGGHFGWVHRVFVAETLAPIVLGTPDRVGEGTCPAMRHYHERH